MKRKNIELTKTKSTVANEANLLPTKHKRRLQETYSVEPRVSRRIPLPAREQKKKKKSIKNRYKSRSRNTTTRFYQFLQLTNFAIHNSPNRFRQGRSRSWFSDGSNCYLLTWAKPPPQENSLVQTSKPCLCYYNILLGIDLSYWA